MKMWLVYSEMDEYSRGPETFTSYKRAKEAYEEYKQDARECADDLGFDGDEAVILAQVETALLSVSVCNEENTAWHFEWEEFRSDGVES